MRAADGLVRALAPRQMARAVGRPFCTTAAGSDVRKALGEAVELPGALQRSPCGNRELLELGPVELEELLPFGPAPSTDSDPALSVEHLLHPETGGRAIEEAEQLQVVVFGGVFGELDDRRGSV